MGLFSQKPKDKHKLLQNDVETDVRPKTIRRTSETAVRAPPQGYHGPHFHQGPAQEDIWNRRQQNIQIPYEDIRGRSHSFHSPIKQHGYSNPYEIRPGSFTERMKQEYTDYHEKTESCNTNFPAVRQAKNLEIGRKHTPQAIHGRKIMAGIDLAIERRIHANT